MEFLMFVYFIAFIVLIVKQIHLKKRLNSKDSEILNLKTQLRDISSKLYFIYDCMKEIGAVPGFEKSEKATAEKTSTAVATETEDQRVQQNVGVHTVQGQTSVSPANVPVRADSKSRSSEIPVKETSSPPPAQNAVCRNNIPRTFSSPYSNVMSAANYAPSHIQSANIPQPNRPYGSSASSVHDIQQNNRKQKKHIEEWLGARFFNIAASLLIFIGLILFCTLSTEQVTNTMKMIAMFAVSGGFIAVGAFISRKDKSVFPLGMLGCGFGTFFISILLSHVYFRSMGDIAAFSLILVWSAFALFMSKRLNSVMLSVTAHIGTAVSICFAFSLGLTVERVILLTVYQLAAIAVIIAGNIFCCRKTYRFGLVMSQFLLLYTSITMSAAFSEKFIMPQSISVPAAAAIYAVQFAAVSFVSYLVSTSAAALEKQGEGAVTVSAAIHSVNKLLWSAGTIASVGCITFFIARNAYHISGKTPMVIALCAAAFVHLIITLLMEVKLNFSERLSTLSVWFISMMIAGALFAQASESGTPFLFVYALMLIGIFVFTKNKGITPIAAAVLFVEAVYMTFYGYFVKENVWFSIPYMFAMGVVLLLLWYVQAGGLKQKYFKYMKISEYLWISASIISINASEFSDISVPLIFSEFALMNIICYFIKFGSDREPELKTVVKAESMLTIYLGIFSFVLQAEGDLGSNNIIIAVFVLMIAAISAVYIYDFAKSKSTFLQVIAAVTASVFFTFFAAGFEDSFNICRIYTYTLGWIPMMFVFSTVLMVIYLKNKNHRLAKILWIGIITDMLIMCVFGYREFISTVEFIYRENNPLPHHIITTGVLLAHAAALLGYTFLINNITSESGCALGWTKDISRYISYFWLNAAFPTVMFSAFYMTGLSQYKSILAAIVAVAVNAAVFALNYQGKMFTKFNWTVRIVSAIVFYISLGFMSFGRGDSVSKYAVSVVLIAACTALYFLKSRDLMKHCRTTFNQIYIGINFTILVNCAIHGLSSNFDFAFVFSIITMITALVCITVGFIAKAKGMRIYGLILVMLCIIKLVTIDISSADSLARVVAFIVGGIICFIISGIYNKVEKSFKNEVRVAAVNENISVNRSVQNENDNTETDLGSTLLEQNKNND